MKAYLVHLFTTCGGGERTSLEMAKVIRDMGFSVTYVTNNRTGMQKCAELFGLPGDYEVIEVHSLMEKLLSLTGRFYRYRRLLLVAKAYETILRHSEIDLSVDSGTNNLAEVDISYIHYPVVLGTVESSALHWRLYNWLVHRKARSMFGKPGLILTNSTWTARLIKEVYGLDVKVLYPPVDVEFYAYDNRPKEKIIVTISRLTPEKNLHMLPRVASRLPDYEWYLVGTTGTMFIEKTVSKRILEGILAEKNKWGANNLHVLTNLPRKDLRELLQRASFYVHPPFAEHFGIAVVEAMAAGAIPIVYMDGGAWTDIVSHISPYLGYGIVDEIPEKIRTLENCGEIAELRKKAADRSKAYSVKVFREKYAEVVGEYLESSRIRK